MSHKMFDVILIYINHRCMFAFIFCLPTYFCFLSLKHRFQGLSMLFMFTWQSSVDWFGRQLMGFWTFHVHQNGGYFANFLFFFYFTLVRYFK